MRYLNRKTIARAAGGAIAGLVLAASPAVAQQQANPDTPPSWAKRCKVSGGNSLCDISFGRMAKGEDGKQYWSSNVGIQEFNNGERRDFFVLAPLGVSLRSGVLYRIDAAEPAKLDYSICVSSGCRAGQQADEPFIQSLKRGGTLRLQFVQLNGKAIGANITLTGFTAAYDGPAVETVDVPVASSQ